MFSFIFGILFIVFGVKEIVKKEEMKGYEKYTQESVVKFRPVLGILFIIFGAFQMFLGLVEQQIIPIDLFSIIDRMTLQLIAVIAVIVVMSILYFAILRKDPNQTEKKRREANEDEDED